MTSSTFKKSFIAIVILLLVILYGYTTHIDSSELEQADNFARGIARDAQDICKKQTVCPEHLEGWEYTGEQYAWKYYGTRRIKIGYAGSSKNFQVFVRHGFASGLVINGGVSNELIEARWKS